MHSEESCYHRAIEGKINAHSEHWWHNCAWRRSFVQTAIRYHDESRARCREKGSVWFIISGDVCHLTEEEKVCPTSWPYLDSAHDPVCWFHPKCKWRWWRFERKQLWFFIRGLQHAKNQTIMRYSHDHTSSPDGPMMETILQNATKLNLILHIATSSPLFAFD